MTEMGQEDQFPRPRLNGRYGFSQGTLAGTRGNGRATVFVRAWGRPSFVPRQGWRYAPPRDARLRP
jgi:hypothetical protein